MAVKKINFRIYIFLLALVLILSFFLRTHALNVNPPGFFADEAAIGYNAYKILKTGKDEFGVPFPVFFRSFGDYRLPIPIYANVPVIDLFGLRETSIRLTAVIFGLISILFTVLSVSKVYGKKAGLLTGFFMGILPWHIQMSRWGSEYIYFPAFLSIAFYFYIKSFDKKLFLIISFLFFGLTMYTYYPTLFITPIFIAACSLVWVIKKGFRQIENLIIALFLYFLICLPLAYGYKSGVLMTRWRSVDTANINLTDKISRALITYRDHFTPDFLFFNGDSGFPQHFISRHSVRGVGEMYVFQFPLILLGLYILFSKRNNFVGWLVILMIFLYPLGSSVANDGPLATRSIIGIIPFSIMTGLGMGYIIDATGRIKNSILKLTVFLMTFFIIGISLANYSHLLYDEYPLYSADFWGWQYGPKEIIGYFETQKDNYDELYMTGYFNAPGIFLKFYDPEGTCRNCFIGGTDKYSPEKKQLFALRMEEYNRLVESSDLIPRVKKTIYLPNKNPEYQIVEFSNKNNK